MENKEETITINKLKYDRLIKAEDFLECLKAVGVDNWPGYGDAQAMFRGENDS